MYVFFANNTTAKTLDKQRLAFSSKREGFSGT